MTQIPENLKYTRSHEWVLLEAAGTYLMGITDHAQALLGDVVYVELPEVGKTFTANAGCGVVESVKAAADVYAPVAGTVVAVNEDLNQQPELMNTDPYGKGWLCRFQPEDPAALNQLMDAKAYETSIND
ncbi:MAG: glycine cleavage system protein GcvH [Gammaproteobacteria bacterium]